MSIVGSFNELLKGFLDSMSATFPENVPLAVACNTFDAVVGAEPSFALDAFAASVGPHAAQLTGRDPAIFSQPLFPGLDLAVMWGDPGLDEGTRESIWQYLQNLHMLASLKTALPPAVLETAEAVARDLATELGPGADLQNLSLDALVAKVAQRVQGDAGLGALIGGLGGRAGDGAAAASEPAAAGEPHRRKKKKPARRP